MSSPNDPKTSEPCPRSRAILPHLLAFAALATVYAASLVRQGGLASRGSRRGASSRSKPGDQQNGGRAPAAAGEQGGEQGHEGKDANAWGVVLTAVGIAAGIAVVLAVSAGLMNVLSVSEPRVQLSRSAVPRELPALPSQPPSPRLQANPAEDWQAMRARDEARLSSYGWVDRKAQIAHMPIQRAMDLIVQRGLAGEKAAIAFQKNNYMVAVDKPLTQDQLEHVISSSRK